MSRHRYLPAVALGLSLAFAGLVARPAVAAKEVPFLSGRVVDDAHLLTADARQRIDDELAALEKQTGDQVAVLTTPSLDGEVLEDYSLKVARTWGLGGKSENNGVLLVVVPDDRKMRIEVGYGLEGKLTDLQTHVIQDDVMRPRFQGGDFAGGIAAGVDGIASALRGEAVATPERAQGGEDVRGMPAASKLGFGLIFLVLVGTFSLLALFSSGFQSWFLYALLTPFYWTFPSAFLGAGAGTGFALGWLIGFPLLKILLGRKGGGPRGGGWRSRRRSWPVFLPTGVGGWSSRGGGGWGGGGGFGGGGFSGGGGSFGGGGSSGSW